MVNKKILNTDFFFFLLTHNLKKGQRNQQLDNPIPSCTGVIYNAQYLKEYTAVWAYTDANNVKYFDG